MNAIRSLYVVLVCMPMISMARVNRYAYDERPDANLVRTQASYYQNLETPNYNIELENNGDQKNVADYAGNFTKTFEHDATTSAATAQGQASYETLVDAVNNGLQATYNAIVRDASATRKLANPQASAAWSLVGRDSSLIPLALPPTLDSRHAACEMAEVYLQAICRNVAFNDYGTGTGTDADTYNGGSITENAAKVLTAYGADYKGPKVGGIVTPAVLFRGTATGCLVGPYISQFLLQTEYRINQKLLPILSYVPIASDREFGVTWDNFIAIQNGAVPVPYDASDFSTLRYIIDGRDMGTWVHNDLPVDGCNGSFNVLMNNGFPMAPNLPYYNGSMPNEGAFTTMGAPDVSYLIAGASVAALKHAWAHKWRAARRLRPEAMAGLAHRVKETSTNPYGLNADLFATLDGINVMDWNNWRNQQQLPSDPANDTYLLGQMYPEASPTHPSYPAGHAVVAGACTTIVKALVDDEALFSAYLTPVKPDPADPTMLVALSGEGEDVMTVGGELDKFASNIALGRDFAGVHYRSDGDEGINLGEQVAIYYLQDWARTYMEQDFTGFELTKRDGTRIRITATDIIPL